MFHERKVDIQLASCFQELELVLEKTSCFLKPSLSKFLIRGRAMELECELVLEVIVLLTERTCLRFIALDRFQILSEA